MDLDKSFREDIYTAVSNTEWEEEYNKFLNLLMKEEII
jgi:hypothetical protein